MPSPSGAPHVRVVLASLLLAGVAFALSQTLVAPALPAIQRSFDASPTSAAWILTGYLLAASVATPLVGKLGDLYGRGPVLTLVLIVFSVGSVICALAGSLGVLIAGRLVQGVGGGIFPLAFGIIRDAFPPQRVAGAIGGLSATFGIGGGLGLVLAGLIVEHLDIAWLFWLGLVCLPAAAAVWRYVPREAVRAGARIDWLGAAMLSAALTALLLGVSKANDWGWGAGRTLGLIVGGLVLGVAWVLVELRVAEPLVEMRVLRRRPVLMTNLTAVLIGFAMFASFLLVPQLAQTPERFGYGFGATVIGAGLLMLPSTLVMLVAGPAAGRLAAIAPRLPLLLGTAITALAFLLYALLHETSFEVAAIGALFGIGLGFAYAAMANLVVASVPGDEVGVATGINTVMRTIGGAFGSQVVATLLTGRLIAGTPVPAEAAYTDAFLLAAVAAALAGVAALGIPAQGQEEAPVGAPAYSRA
jgi:EmrB/QacA subfamily drug resistance transporter